MFPMRRGNARSSSSMLWCKNRDAADGRSLHSSQRFVPQRCTHDRSGSGLAATCSLSMPAAVRLRMKTRRIDHSPTAKEIEERKKWSWSRPPKYYFVATDKIRLEIGAGNYGSLVLEDTVATRIEDKLLRAITRIQQISDDAVARAEAQRLRAIEAEEARQQAEALRKRAHTYGHWVEVLDSMRKDFEHHRRLVPVVAGLREALPSREGSEHYDALLEYVEWAEEHLAASDPFRLIHLPNGERPDLSYREWRRWDAQNPQRW